MRSSNSQRSNDDAARDQRRPRLPPVQRLRRRPAATRTIEAPARGPRRAVCARSGGAPGRARLVGRVMSAPRDADKCKHQRHESGKELAFRLGKRLQHVAPDALLAERGRVRVHVGGEAETSAAGRSVSQLVAQRGVRQQKRRRDRGGEHAGGAQSAATCAGRARGAVCATLPQHVRRSERREVEQVIAARQVLQRPARPPRRQADEARPAVEVASQPVQHERHPLRRQHLQVRGLRQAVRREREQQAGDERRHRVARSARARAGTCRAPTARTSRGTAGCSRGSDCR